MRPRILAALADGPLTVPEIAEAIGAPTHEIVFWVMGMRRYGWLAEIKGSDGRRLLPLRAHRAGVLMTATTVPAATPRPPCRPRPLPRDPEVRRHRHQRLLLVRHLHRDAAR